MGFYIVRFSEGDSSEPLWGVERDERVLPLEVRSTTLRELIERGGIEAARARLDDPRDDGARSPEELTFWSPVTHPCQIVCQGKNYLEHLKETGARPQDKTFNLLFSKASSTLNRPDGPVVRPAGVKLMDYECELGLHSRKGARDDRFRFPGVSDRGAEAAARHVGPRSPLGGGARQGDPLSSGRRLRPSGPLGTRQDGSLRSISLTCCLSGRA